MSFGHLSETLRANGQKVTAQRLAVFQAMQGRTDHPAAEDVFLTVRATLPTISRGTVYKILNELVAIGELRQVDVGDGRTRFDPNTAQHVHLRCVDCGQLLDLDCEAAPVQAPKSAAGFEILRWNLTLEGRCPACRSRLA
jgi:Fur family peroxide stress response transcriptional regulator